MPRHAWLRLPRIYVDVPLAAKESVELHGKAPHYVVNVRRLNKGDEVLLFNGRDGEWLATLQTIGKASLLLLCQQQTRPQQSASILGLAFAGIRREHQEYMIEKASELGVSDFYPILSDHSQVSQFNSHRLRLIAIEAAQQSERLDIPSFHPPQDMEAALQHLAEHHFQLIACLERGHSVPILQAMQCLTAAKVSILIGPEGGWSDQEIDVLQRSRQVSTVSLGERILRADTAAIAALSCWSCLRDT